MMLSLLLAWTLSQNTGLNDRHFEDMIAALNVLGQKAEQAEVTKDDHGAPLLDSPQATAIRVFTISEKKIVQKLIDPKKWWPVVNTNYATLSKKLSDRTKSNLREALKDFETTLKAVKP